MTSRTKSLSRFAVEADHPRYKWVALSNTTLGVLMATINSSIVIISLPAIFRGIKLDPLRPGNVSYLLWMLMGFLVVTAVLVVTLGRLGDMYGRVKVYNLGFAVFTVGSLALVFDPLTQGGGAMWLILWRVVQGVGAAMLFAQGNLGSPKSETAREKAKAKNQRSRDVEFSRSGTGLRPGVEIQIREQENRKEPSFGKDESKNANLVLVRTLDLRGVLADHRVGPVRIRDIP